MHYIKNILISISILFAGCATTPKSSVVHINEQCSSDTLEIVDIKGKKQADGFMKTQIVGKNNADHYQKLQYKIVWLDNDGFAIKSVLSKWRDISADANQEFYITNISPTTKASDFKVYIRQDNKEIQCNQEQNTY
jgi:uncharacterized protein YcfL